MNDAWQAGDTAAVSDTDTDWVRQARPGPLLGLCGFVVAAVGLMAAVVWPQLFAFGYRPYGVTQYVTPPLISALGVLLVVVGAVLASGRLWAALTAVPSMGLLLMLSLFWTVYSALRGGIAPLYPMLVVGSGVGLMCAVIGLGMSMRVHRARRALLAD